MCDKEVGQRIVALRELNECTRAELARRINITAKFLYEIETGRHGFSAKILGNIAQALGVSSDYLLFGKEADSVLPEEMAVLLGRLDEKQYLCVQQILREIVKLCGGSDC